MELSDYTGRSTRIAVTHDAELGRVLTAISRPSTQTRTVANRRDLTRIGHVHEPQPTGRRAAQPALRRPGPSRMIRGETAGREANPYGQQDVDHFTSRRQRHSGARSAAATAWPVA